MEKPLFPEEPYLKNEHIVMKKLCPSDAGELEELAGNTNVYRYLPTFLLEQKYDDPKDVIRHLYDDHGSESIILGIFENDALCGLAEIYGYQNELHTISVGCRLLERYWGRGIATQSLTLLVDYLFRETEIEVITASTMTVNTASANVLQKNGFSLVAHAVDEDWGYDTPTATDNWMKTKPAD